MKSILITLAASMILTSCGQLCQGDSGKKYSKKRRSSEPYWPVKVCSHGDLTGESCISFRAKKISISSAYTRIIDLEGDEYQYNNAGWSMLISPKVE